MEYSQECNPDAYRGFYQKYHVTRIRDPLGKHENCEYFVLDLKHDKFAKAALKAYIKACEKKYPSLAADLRRKVKEL
jgi:hypothetical protein